MKVILASLVFLAAGAAIASGGPLNVYVQTNLTSDLHGVAANQDPNLVNPWGLVAGSATPFWAADNGTGLSTLYNGSGAKQGLVVTVPPANANPGPTGIVFNSTTSFGGSHFIFDTEAGTVAGWISGNTAVLGATGAPGSVYKGLAIGNNGSANLLYAANFGLGRIDVYNSSFGLTTAAGGFTDLNLPAGYAPFNVQNIGGQLYVTFAKSGGHDEIDGPGLGFVDVFDLNGNLLKRLASQGPLNAPWGLAIAPSNFGAFSGDLLVGNFGNGTIEAYDPTSGTFEGNLDGANGDPLVIEGLWGLSFGNGAPGQSVDTLYFNAGIPGPGNVEDHGLFGELNPVPEPEVLPLTCIGFASVLIGGIRRRLKAGDS